MMRSISPVLQRKFRSSSFNPFPSRKDSAAASNGSFLELEMEWGLKYSSRIFVKGGNMGELYVVATPIGNLGDITLRALEVLKGADVVAAEDTRTSSGLLRHFGISTRLVSLHQHNERQKSEAIVSLLREGKKVALVTDAGTPGISDPGDILAQRVREAGFGVVPVPGACAAIAALSVSGLAGNGFLFRGFLPAKSSQRKKELEALKEISFSLVFYEAPHRVLEFARDLAEVFGESRRVFFAREITKLHEEIQGCLAGEAPAWLEPRQRGEYVIVAEGAQQEPPSGISDEAKRILGILLQHMSVSQAAKAAAEISGERRGELYDFALKSTNRL